MGVMGVEWHAEEEQRIEAQIQQRQAQGASAMDMRDKAVDVLPEEAGAMLQLSAASVALPAAVLTKEG